MSGVRNGDLIENNTEKRQLKARKNVSRTRDIQFEVTSDGFDKKYKPHPHLSPTQSIKGEATEATGDKESLVPAYELPKPSSSSSSQFQMGVLDSEIKNKVSHLYQNIKPRRMDSANHLAESEILQDSPDPDNRVHKLDANFSGDRFNTFKNIVKEDRAIVERADVIIESMGHKFSALDSQVVKSDGSFCCQLVDLIKIILEKTLALEDVRGEFSFLQEKEEALSQAMARVHRLIETSVADMGELMGLLEKDETELMRILGNFCNVEDEREIMEKFGDPNDNRLKRVKGFELDYIGTDTEEYDSSYYDSD